MKKSILRALLLLAACSHAPVKENAGCCAVLAAYTVENAVYNDLFFGYPCTLTVKHYDRVLDSIRLRRTVPADKEIKIYSLTVLLSDG
jgi:hypothetical protein